VGPDGRTPKGLHPGIGPRGIRGDLGGTTRDCTCNLGRSGAVVQKKFGGAGPYGGRIQCTRGARDVPVGNSSAGMGYWGTGFHGKPHDDDWPSGGGRAMAPKVTSQGFSFFSRRRGGGQGTQKKGDKMGWGPPGRPGIWGKPPQRVRPGPPFLNLGTTRGTAGDAEPQYEVWGGPPPRRFFSKAKKKKTSLSDGGEGGFRRAVA